MSLRIGVGVGLLFLVAQCVTLIAPPLMVAAIANSHSQSWWQQLALAGTAYFEHIALQFGVSPEVAITRWWVTVAGVLVLLALGVLAVLRPQRAYVIFVAAFLAALVGELTAFSYWPFGFFWLREGLFVFALLVLFWLFGRGKSPLGPSA